jgi:hypothetical protein
MAGIGNISNNRTARMRIVVVNDPQRRCPSGEG